MKKLQSANLSPRSRGVSLLADLPKTLQICLGLVRLASLVKFHVSLFGLRGLERLALAAALRLLILDSQLGYAGGGLVDVRAGGDELLARSLGVVGVGRHVIIFLLLGVAGRQVADLNISGLGAGDGSLLACLFLLLAFLATQLLRGCGAVRRPGIVVGLFVRVFFLGGGLLVGVVFLRGIFSPHGNLVSIGVEGSEVAREMLATCG